MKNRISGYYLIEIDRLFARCATGEGRIGGLDHLPGAAADSRRRLWPGVGLARCPIFVVPPPTDCDAAGHAAYLPRALYRGLAGPFRYGWCGACVSSYLYFLAVILGRGPQVGSRIFSCGQAACGGRRAPALAGGGGGGAAVLRLWPGWGNRERAAALAMTWGAPSRRRCIDAPAAPAAGPPPRRPAVATAAPSRPPWE